MSASSSSSPSAGPSYDSWIGRQEKTADTVSAEAVRRLCAILNWRQAVPGLGDSLPPGWHWIFGITATPSSEIGPDGHALRGDFLPPVPLPRRMWGGSRITCHAPLRVGDAMTRLTTIDDIRVREGKSGSLVVVTLRHEVSGNDRLCLVEEQDVIYRESAAKSAVGATASAKAIPAGEWGERVVPDPVLLFRFSAVTFNGHRIHYDRPYATETEGYPGLVVHGPLTALLLLDLLRRKGPKRPIARIAVRAMAPLFDIAPFCLEGVVEGDDFRLWAWGPAAEGDNGEKPTPDLPASAIAMTVEGRLETG